MEVGSGCLPCNEQDVYSLSVLCQAGCVAMARHAWKSDCINLSQHQQAKYITEKIAKGSAFFGTVQH